MHDHLIDLTQLDTPIAAAPHWLLERVGRPRDKAKNADQAAEGADIDSEYNVSRATAMLGSLDAAAPGERNMKCWQTASDVRALGVSRTTCAALMQEHWRCEPMLDDDEFHKAVDSAYDNAKQPMGVNDPNVDFKADPSAAALSPVVKGKHRLYLEWQDAVQVQTQSRYVVKGLIDAGAMSVVYGPSNVGKSFFTMDLGFAIAQGKPWRGYKTQKGMVAYVAAEGGAGSRKRIAAFRKHHAIAPDVPFALIPCSVDLLDPDGDLKALVTLIRDASVARGWPCVFIVVDTLSRAMGGGNENAPDDMGAFVRHVDALRQHTGAHVLIIHHSGKDAAKGARGHSSLRAATDTEIEIEGASGSGKVRVTKQRDLEPVGPFGFTLRSVDVGVDEEGDVIQSAVVEEAAISDASDDFTLEPLRAEEDATCLRALAEAVKANGVPAPEGLGLPDNAIVATLEQWKNAYLDMSGGWSNTVRQRFRRSSERLRDQGYVSGAYDLQWISAAARKLLHL